MFIGVIAELSFKKFTFTQGEKRQILSLKHSLFHKGAMTTNYTLIPIHSFCNVFCYIFQYPLWRYLVYLRTCKFCFFLYFHLELILKWKESVNLCFIFKTICRNSNNFPISSVTGITPRNTFNNSWCVILYTPPSHLYLIFEQKSCVNIKNYIYIRRCMLKADIWETYRQKFGKGKLSQVSHLSLSYGEVAWLYLQEEELNFLPLCKF